MFAEGKDLAEQSEILEQPGGLEGNPEVSPFTRLPFNKQ